MAGWPHGLMVKEAGKKNERFGGTGILLGGGTHGGGRAEWKLG